MTYFRRILFSCLSIFLAAQTALLVRIQYPAKLNFDEAHYVPAAKEFLAHIENHNWEHPLLGKMLIASGIAMFGDEPLGWRFMSTVFGALTLVAVFVWALAIFRKESAAWFATALTAFNQLLYVQSRIAMLDTFMVAFLVGALAAYSWTWHPEVSLKTTRRSFWIAGVLFGLANACKWASIVPWVFCLGLIGLLKIIQSWQTRFEKPGPDDWYFPGLWKGLSNLEIVSSLVLIPIVVYFITFLPFLWADRPPGSPAYTLWDLWLMQPKMWDGQLRVTSSHPYMSQWTGWALMIRPIWYAFDPDGPDSVRGVIFLGNPFVMWGGLLALAGCFWGWVQQRSRTAFLILSFYAVLYLGWALIPRKIAFYYYYYPAALVLSLALTWVAEWLETQVAGGFRALKWGLVLVASAFFVYFYPILGAQRIPANAFQDWMWLRSWI